MQPAAKPSAIRDGASRNPTTQEGRTASDTPRRQMRERLASDHQSSGQFRVPDQQAARILPPAQPSLVERVSELRQHAEAKGGEFRIVRESATKVVFETRQPGYVWLPANSEEWHCQSVKG